MAHQRGGENPTNIADDDLAWEVEAFLTDVVELDGVPPAPAAFFLSSART